MTKMLSPLTDLNLSHSAENASNIVRLRQSHVNSTHNGSLTHAFLTSNLPVTRNRHDSKGVLRVLIEFDITDVGGGIVLALPSRWSKIAISVKFRVVHAKKREKSG